MKRIFLITALLLASTLPNGCAQPAPAAGGPIISMTIGNRTFHLEVAATPQTQKAGLSNHDTLAADQGLIYVYTDETEHFRMENAHMALDVIFVNTAGNVVTIRPLNANDPAPVRSDKPTFYAIELPRGTADALAIKAGDHLAIPPAASHMAIAQIKIGKTTFDLEVAASNSDQETGLMSRDALPEARGMIFVFPQEQARSFWMKNTRIPLDILFLDSAGKVVSAHTMRPYDLSLTSSDSPARYAIELNQGIIEATGVKVGDTLTIPPEAKAK